MVVLKKQMSRSLYRLVGNVQMNGATGRTTTSHSSERQVARRKRVTCVSLAKGCDDLSGLSYVKQSALILIKVEIVENDKNQLKKKEKANEVKKRKKFW